MELVAAPSDREDDDEPFQRGPSTILIQIVEGDSYLFHTHTRNYQLDYDALDYDKGDAAIEAEQGMLSDAVVPLMEPDFWKIGWFVVEGFTAHYTRGDGWMTDDDADFYCESVRPARWSDLKAFGYPVPWFRRIALFDCIVPARHAYPCT